MKSQFKMGMIIVILLVGIAMLAAPALAVTNDVSGSAPGGTGFPAYSARNFSVAKTITFTPAVPGSNGVTYLMGYIPAGAYIKKVFYSSTADTTGTSAVHKAWTYAVGDNRGQTNIAEAVVASNLTAGAVVDVSNLYTAQGNVQITIESGTVSNATVTVIAEGVYFGQ